MQPRITIGHNFRVRREALTEVRWAIGHKWSGGPSDSKVLFSVRRAIFQLVNFYLYPGQSMPNLFEKRLENPSKASKGLFKPSVCKKEKHRLSPQGRDLCYSTIQKKLRGVCAASFRLHARLTPHGSPWPPGPMKKSPWTVGHCSFGKSSPWTYLSNDFIDDP